MIQFRGTNGGCGNSCGSGNGVGIGMVRAVNSYRDKVGLGKVESS